MLPSLLGDSLDVVVTEKGKGAGSQLPLLDARKGCKRKNSSSWNTLRLHPSLPAHKRRFYVSRYSWQVVRQYLFLFAQAS